MLRALMLTGALLSAGIAHAATPPQLVVFIGDQLTYNWWANSPGGFPSNWVNWGTPGVGVANSGGSAAEVLARFQADVSSSAQMFSNPKAPPSIIAHIMVGSVDADIQSAANHQTSGPAFITAIQGLVKVAKAGNIQIIFGLEPQAGTSGYITPFNSVIETIAAQNNIPVINYGDALCECVTALDGGTVTPSNTYLVPNAATGTPPAITSAGYALMTQMVENAIATAGKTLKGGYLQDLEASASAPAPNVNTVYPGAQVQFTPMGEYSNGATESITNTTFYGSTGTWASSNPLVMYVNPQGLAYALSAGTAAITYTSPTGVKFSEWIMYVDN